MGEMEASAEGLDVMVPRSATITVGGQSITVRELTIEQGVDFLAAASSLLGAGWGDPAKMMSANRGVFLNALANAVEVDGDWLKKQRGVEVVRLARLFVETNADFFAEALGPPLQALVRLVTRAIQQAGLTASSA